MKIIQLTIRISLVLAFSLVGLPVQKVIAQDYLKIDRRVLAINPELANIQEQIKKEADEMYDRESLYTPPPRDPNREQSIPDSYQREAVGNALDQYERGEMISEEQMFMPTGQEVVPVSPPVMMPPPTPMPSMQEEIFIPQPVPDEIFAPQPIGDEVFMPQTPATSGAGDVFVPQSLMGDEMALFQEIPMVISASKRPTPINEAPASVYVITQEDIKQSGSIHLFDVLRQVPGMDVSATTTGQADVSLRGFNSFVTNKTLVLVDGRSIYSPVQGIQLWETIPIPLEEIDRIEVVKGPVAALYGANANLGLINIITKTPEQIDGVIISDTFGSHNTHRGALLVGTRHEDLAIKFSSEWKETDSFERRGSVDPLGALTFRNLENKDALDVFKQNVDLTYHFEEDSFFRLAGGYTNVQSLTFMISDLATDFFGLLSDEVESLVGPLSGYAGYTTGAYKYKNFGVIASWTFYDTDFQSESFDGVKTRGDTVELETRTGFQAGDHTIVVGGGGKYDVVESDLFPIQANPSKEEKTKSQNNWNFYMQEDWKLTDQLSFNASARIDYYSISHYNPSARLATVYNPTPNDTFRTSVGYSFRNPTFSDYYLNQNLNLSVLNVAVARGNEFVDPERFITYEAGYQGRRWDGKFRPFIDYYWTKISELIRLESDIGLPAPVRFLNKGDAYSQGVEMGYEVDLLKNLSWDANYAFNNTFYRGNPGTEDHFPEKKINSGLRLSLFDNKLTSKIQLHYVWPFETIVTDPNLVTLGASDASIPSYRLLNAWIGLKLNEDTEVSISGFNLLKDEHREISRGDTNTRRILGKIEVKF